MRIRWLVVSFAALLVMSACVPRSVSRGATAVAVITLGCDWNQTREVAADGWRSETSDFTERNPILGEKPSVGSVDAYMAVAAVGLILVSERLAPGAALALAGVVTALEVRSVQHNLGSHRPLCR